METLKPEESDAVAVINAAIERNATLATELEAEANSHENAAGEARLRAVAYREANDNLTKQLALLNAPAPAKPPVDAAKAAKDKAEAERVEKAWQDAEGQQADPAKPASKENQRKAEETRRDERWLGGKPTNK